MSELKDVSGGEWASEDAIDAVHDMQYACAIKASDGYYVGWCYGNSPEEALANARLMAAAKDMAEALRDLLQFPEDSFDGVIKRNAEAALKKAGAV